MKEELKEERGETRTVTSGYDPRTDADKVGQVVVEPVCVTFTKAESAVVMALIRAGWATAVLGSREGFELLARVEDEMRGAGAMENELPPAKN